MKNIFRFLMAVAVLFTASCAKEDISSSIAGGEVEVTFTANLPELGTRAYADGTNANILYYNVYDAATDTLLQVSGSKEADATNLFIVNIPMLKGMTYDIVFWAVNKDGGYYTLNGKEITGDPGATAEYPFSITIAVPANDTIESKTREIIVEDADGHRDVCLLTSAAGDAYVTVPEGAIEIDYLGNAVTIAIQSNTTWTIE
jgi:hypothetical protein